MILLINICKERLHYLEFIGPIEDILRLNNHKYSVKHYLEIKDSDLKKADKIIICGTSLADNQFIEQPDKFEWIKSFDKPLLGICGGMQIIAAVFGGKMKQKTEIGFFRENFKKEFLGIKGEQEAYHLHNNYLTLPKDFEDFTNSDIPQAIKHKAKNIYGTLFHPEVRQKGLIINFSRL